VAARPPSVPFSQRLVLQSWLLSLLGVERFADLADTLRAEELEGLDASRTTKFHHALVRRFGDAASITADELLRYDRHIVAHTDRLNERRRLRQQPPIVWKYYQYIALLFTEIYLDRHFAKTDPRAQPNRLALWTATGSGKTLLMHANVLQYRHYVEATGRQRDLNRIILITPNEGMSRQHLAELEAAGLPADIFTSESRELFGSRSIEILDIHKLRGEAGAKTFAIEAFESNNLVLVDEGHRGASAGDTGAWMRARNALSADGFSFEYSATFGQAVKGNEALAEQYARCIALDYSYSRFYEDGFGKDYQILNLEDGGASEARELYLVACFLTFYQQLRVYRDHRGVAATFNIERPLLVFVGSSVNAVRTEKGAQVSDVIDVLLFLARFLADRDGSIDRIDRVLRGEIVDATGNDLFAGRFAYLLDTRATARQIYGDCLESVFHAKAGGALHVENLRGAQGELALRVGDEPPFGMINVGDDAKLFALCEKREELVTTEREFAGSLFDQLAVPDSTVEVLIGSKKFTEGWNSWRVATMGLLNVGVGEGAQVIQLFGRGVRLKGYARSLKRSGYVALPAKVERPGYLTTLETLNVFGVRAKYMAQFRELLAEEGLAPNERLPTIEPPVRSPASVPSFAEEGPAPTLLAPSRLAAADRDRLLDRPVVVNWYPRIAALRSSGEASSKDGSPHEGALTAWHVALLDLDRVYTRVHRLKEESGLHAFNLPREAIEALLEDPSWYRLQIPARELAFDSFARVAVWEEIAVELVKRYALRYYEFRRSQTPSRERERGGQNAE